MNYEDFWMNKANELYTLLDTDDTLPDYHPDKLSDNFRNDIINRINSYNQQIMLCRYPPPPEDDDDQYPDIDPETEDENEEDE
jgi:hypothetical protein